MPSSHSAEAVVGIDNVLIINAVDNNCMIYSRGLLSLLEAVCFNIVSKQLWGVAEQHLPEVQNARYTQAMMDLGYYL